MTKNKSTTRAAKRASKEAKPKRNRRTPPLLKLEGDLAPSDPLYTIKEAAPYVKMSVSALYKSLMARDPKKPDRYIPDGPTPTRIGGRVRFLKSDLDAFIRANRKIRAIGM